MMLFYNILSLLGTSHEQSQCHCHRQKESTSLSLHVTGTKSPCHCHCMSQTQSPCHCHVELPRGRGSWKDLTKELSVSTAADFSSTTSVSFSHLILFSYRKDRKKRKKKTLISPQSVQENHKVTCRTTNHTSHTTQLIKHCVTPHEQHKHNATHHMACHLTRKQHHLCYTTHHMLHNLSCNKSEASATILINRRLWAALWYWASQQSWKVLWHAINMPKCSATEIRSVTCFLHFSMKIRQTKTTQNRYWLCEWPLAWRCLTSSATYISLPGNLLTPD